MFVIMPSYTISCCVVSPAITIHSYWNPFMIFFFQAHRCSYSHDAGYSYHGRNCVDGMGLTSVPQSHRLQNFSSFGFYVKLLLWSLACHFSTTFYSPNVKLQPHRPLVYAWVWLSSNSYWRLCNYGSLPIRLHNLLHLDENSYNPK